MSQGIAALARPQVAGMIAPGNIDLRAQPRVRNPGGSMSTVDSLSVNIDGKEVLLPTVTPDGRHFTGPDAADRAVAEYQRSGLHLGIFESPTAATAYAEQLHNEYAAGAYGKGRMSRYSVLPPSLQGGIASLVRR